MTQPLDRHLRTAHDKTQLPALLQSLFALELARPSAQVWLVAPWISDIPVLDNSAGQFEAVAPLLPRTTLRLSTVVAEIARRQSSLYLLYLDQEQVAPFRRRLEEALGPQHPALHAAVLPNLHEKCLLGDDYYLTGSANLTHNALFRNDEHAVLQIDAGEVGQQRSHLQALWQGADQL